MLQYFYTKYGDVYAGYRWDEINFPEHTIIIQGTKINDYRKLENKDKTIEKISEFGWVVLTSSIVKIFNKDKFDPEKKYHVSDTWKGNYERKYLFIIGAGASAHCVSGINKNDFYKDNLRPPLAISLFEDRFNNYYSKYAGVKELLLNLKTNNDVDVETLFETEWKEIQHHDVGNLSRRHINTQYYLQEILKEVSKKIVRKYKKENLYGILAEKLKTIYEAYINVNARFESKKFAFVSFNQDTILEHFLSDSFKRPIKQMKDYADVNDSPYCIFKPHGSWNWGWKFPKTERMEKESASNWLFNNNTSFFELYYRLLGNHVDMIDWSTWGFETSIHQYRLGKYTIDKSKIRIIQDDQINDHFPALLLPYRDKDEFTMPLNDFMNMHTYLGYVETIIIIGWKGNEAAFNSLLLKHADKINKIIIADPNAEIVKKNLQGLIKKIPQENVIEYKNFEDFILNGLDKEII